MIAATRNRIKSNTPDRGNAPKSASRRPERRGKKRISAAQRWLLISKDVYGRAQQRGFVGGNPFEDLSEAARDIDETYATDVHGLLALTDPVELTEQFRSLFAGYGLGQRALDRLLDMNRDALDKLVESNRLLCNGKAERATRRTSLLQDAAGEALKTLQSITGDAPHADETYYLIDKPVQAVRSSVTRLKVLANSAANFSKGGEVDGDIAEAPAPPRMEIHGAVVKAYDGLTARELAEAPVAALKGVSVANSKRLRSSFRMKTIRDMATSKLVERAEGVVTLADTESDAPAARISGGKSSRTLTDIADGPVARLEGVTRGQAKVLEEAFRIKTVRDLAGNRFFRVARAIVTLAELEE